MQKLLQNFNLGRLSRLALSFCLVMVMAMNVGWGQDKITNFSNIVSGKKYYIGATTGSTDYYLFVDGNALTNSIAGTATTAIGEATPFTFEGSETSWTIRFDNGYYLSLKSSKDNGKVQVVESAATFTASNQSSKIRLSKGNYSIQKNNSGTQFGSYGNTQTDVWLVEVPEQTTTYSVIFNAGDGTFVGNADFPNASNTVAAGTYTLPSATPATGYTFDGWTATGITTPVTGSYTVSGDVDFTAHYTENTTPTPGSDLILDFENELSSYSASWEFTNIVKTNSDITAHGGSYFGSNVNSSGNGVATASIQTKNKVATPQSLTCFVSKRSNNTTASSWLIQTSSDGTYWTDVETQSATSMSKGNWVEFTTDLTNYSDVYVRVYYSGSTALRAIDDITLVTSAPAVATPTFTPVSGEEFGDEGLSVTIACETSGASIYYTLDGSAPDNNSTLYNGAIALTQTTTIMAVAYVGTDASSVVTATYTYVDPNAPGTENNPYTVAQARAAIDAGTGTQGVYATGIVSAIPTAWNTQFNNITFNFVDEEGDADFLQAYRCVSGTGVDASTVAVGDIVVVYGNLTKYNTTYEFGQGCELVSLTHIENNTPSITVSPFTVNVDAEEHVGTLDLTYENLTITEMSDFDIQFYDENNNEITTENKPDWIIVDVAEQDPNVGEGYVVSYYISDNNGAARTTYFKVYAMDDETNLVYSNLVTVTQAEYVAPTYADLPFTFNGGKAAIESTDGLYQEGLGSDYNAENNPNTKLKFDGTGDWLLLQFNERPGTLTFDIKGNSFSGGTFKVQTSVDGTTYSDLKTYTELGDTQSEEFTDLGENVRYIKWVYTNKASGNVGLGNISLAAYTVPQEYTLTVSNLSHVNLFIFGGDESETIISTEDGELTAQVASGTNVEISVDVESGYVIQSLMVDGVEHVNDIDASDMYMFTMPSHDVTITATAVAEVTPPTPTPGTWVLTNLADLTEDDVFVIVGTRTANPAGDYAMSNNNSTSSAPSAVSVTVAEGTLSNEPDDILKWNIEITADGYIFYPNETTSSWLYCTNTNNGVRVGTGDAKHFTLSQNGYLKTTETTEPRYIGIYNDQDWRCYTSSGGNIANQSFSFYKKVEDPNAVSITADNVEIAYDATSGNIAYTINNVPDPAVALTADVQQGATIENLVLGTVTSSAVPFTCDANTSGTARTATVTLTYNYGDNETVTKDVTITQAAAPNYTMTIAEVRAQQTGDVVTKGVVTSCVGTTAYIQDQTAAVCVFGAELTVGDEIRVSGTLSAYHNLLEITSPTVTVISQGNTTTPTVMTIDNINTDYSGDNAWQGWFVTIENATVTAIDGQNTTIAQGDNFIVVRGISSDVTYAVGDVLTLNGNIGCYDAAQIANPQNVTVQSSTDPSITVASATIDAPATGAQGTLTVTYDNITEVVADVWFCNAGGTADATYDWIEAEIDEDNNVEYIIEANNAGAARTAYFKVYALDDGSEDVYSNLVTVTQAAAPQQYTLTIGNPANVTITAVYGTDGVLSNGDNELILSGTEISLTANVSEGYTFVGFTVKDADGNDVALTENNGVYSFNMPLSNVTVNATAAAVAPTTYTLATSIESGKEYIIVGQADGYYYAMGNDKGNNRYAYEITLDGTTATATITNVGVHEFTITSLGVTNNVEYYSIADATTNGGYLYAASSSSNYLKTEPTLDNDHNGDWAISFGQGGSANVVASQSDYTRNIMRFNNSSILFSCYSNGQHPVYLYVKDEINYRISYVTNGSEIEETVAVGGTSVNLPSATATIADWTFAGWSDSYICETQTAPEMVPNPYDVSDNVVLYAVYNNGTSYSSHPNNADCQIVIDNDNPSYTETFEEYSTSTTYWTETKPSCWSLIWIEAPRQPHRRAQVVYEPFYANNNYYLRMDSLNIYAMPPVNVDINTLQMELYVRQPFASHQLQVGVLEENSDGTYVFVPVNTINNQSAYLEYRTVNFSEYNGTGHRIAFKNVYSDGDNGLKSFNYIDDITISRITDNNCSITELPYTENFDEITTVTTERTGVGMDCWTVAEKDYNYTDAYAPQLCHASYYAHSGAYTLLLDGRGIYAMPKLNVEDVTVQNLEMEFYVRQYSASCQLQVGVMSDLNDPSSFEVMKTVGNDGVSGQQRHVVDFSAYEGEGKYIAFRNVYNGTWGRSPQYIDDIDLHVKVEDNCGIISLPYTQSFDELTTETAERTGVQPECWTLVRKDYDYTDNYAQQLCHAAFYAHSGSYSLLLDGRGIYAMPELKVDNNIHEMQLEFYVRQYSANCHLQVGVLSDVNNPSTFVALETITNEGASGQVQHVVDFSQYANSIPAGAKYIAFRNVYDGSWGRSINYLDDITLSLATSTPDAVAEIPQTQGEEPEEYVDDSANTDFEEVMAPTGISDFDLANLTVYPNPTTGMVTIVADEVSRVEVYNQIGVLVARYTNEQVIDLGNLSNGVYVLRVTTPQGVAIRKVVKK